LFVASSAALLTGCSVADDVMATVGLPVSETAPAPEQPDSDTSAMVVTASSASTSTRSTPPGSSRRAI